MKWLSTDRPGFGPPRRLTARRIGWLLNHLKVKNRTGYLHIIVCDQGHIWPAGTPSCKIDGVQWFVDQANTPMIVIRGRLWSISIIKHPTNLWSARWRWGI